MVDTQTAIENVKSLARTFQSVIDLAAALDGVTSIEQACNAANAKLTQLRRELASVTADLANARADTAGEREALTKVRAMAAADADEASATVTALLDKAAAQADEILARANSKADEILARAATDVGDLEARRNLIRHEAEQLEQRVADARAALAKIMGAAA